MSGLDDLIPPTRTVTVGGKTIIVRVLRVRQYSGFTKAIAKPYSLVVNGKYLAAIANFPEELIEAICAATDLDKGFVAELDGDEFLQLAEAVLELNLDFFARAVFPAARKMAKKMRLAMESFDFSPLLSSEGTDTATSSNSPLPN